MIHFLFIYFPLNTINNEEWWWWWLNSCKVQRADESLREMMRWWRKYVGSVAVARYFWWFFSRHKTSLFLPSCLSISLSWDYCFFLLLFSQLSYNKWFEKSRRQSITRINNNHAQILRLFYFTLFVYCWFDDVFL